uniref:Mur ligase family protein n=1 Tax=Shigella flexneri TaxID=623 RepID=UPI0020952476
YERHFMPYHPEYSIITNIDFDHPDYFTSLEDVFNAFNDYAKQITKGLFVYGEDAELRKITSDAPIYYYGTGRGSANAKYFVFESDEYERHFMPYHPEYSIITNIDFDHPDYFTSLEDV